MQDCNTREYARLDRLLNIAYSNAMRPLQNNKPRTYLRNLQRDWLQVRWDACLKSASNLGGGSASDLVYRHCQLQEVVRRTIWLERQIAGSVP